MIDSVKTIENAIVVFYSRIEIQISRLIVISQSALRIFI